MNTHKAKQAVRRARQELLGAVHDLTGQLLGAELTAQQSQQIRDTLHRMSVFSDELRSFERQFDELERDTRSQGIKSKKFKPAKFWSTGGSK